MASQDIDPRLIGLLLMGVKPTPPFSTGLAGRFLRWLRERHGWPSGQRRLVNLLNRESMKYDEVREVLDVHLRYMADLGLLQPVEPTGDGVQRHLEKWRLSSANELMQPPNGGGRGRGGDDNPGQGRGDGDGAGGGVREVLSHPTLFALPQQEFEDFVQGLFDESGAP